MYAQDTKKTFTLVIDAGHGGHDPGAIGKFAKEKTINLNVALSFGNMVKSNCPDVKVIYTRDKDVFIPLQERANIANRNKADLFVSIHTNAAPKGNLAHGTETYTLGTARAQENLAVAMRENEVITLEKDYKETYEGFDNSVESYIIFELMQGNYMKESVELAKMVQNQFKNHAGRKCRGSSGIFQAGFLVLRKTSAPSILTELGFISNPEEEAFLASAEGQKAMAQSLFNAFVNYRKYKNSNYKAPQLIAKAEKVQQVPAQPENTQKTNTLEPEKTKVDKPSVRVVSTEPKVTQTTTSAKVEEKKETTPAKQNETPAKKETTTAKQKETPAKKETTTAKQKETPAKKETTTAKQKETPAKKENTTAKQKETPAKKETTTDKQKETPAKNTTQAATNSTATSKEKKETIVAAPAVDSSKPVFKVQITMNKKKLPGNSSVFMGLSPIDHYVEGSYYKYTYGATNDYNTARKLQSEAKKYFPQAFIIAFVNGKRANLSEAIQLSKKK
jgi:N-acetylmuramoyl-L-alanine amidase